MGQSSGWKKEQVAREKATGVESKLSSPEGHLKHYEQHRQRVFQVNTGGFQSQVKPRKMWVTVGFTFE